MKRLSLILMLIGSVAHAQLDGRRSSSHRAAASDSSLSSSGQKHAINVLTSFTPGGLSLGIGYEYMRDKSTGIGGHARTFQKQDDADKRPADGLFIVGATLSHHFYKNPWDLAITPSINIIKIDPANAAQDDTTTLGPGATISLVWQLTRQVAFGFDHTTYWCWFDDEFNGLLISDFAIKVRATF